MSDQSMPPYGEPSVPPYGQAEPQQPVTRSWPQPAAPQPLPAPPASSSSQGSQGYPAHGPQSLAADDLVLGGPHRHGPRRGDGHRLVAIIASVVLLLAAIAGGGAYVGHRLLASHGSQPETWAPSTTVAFAKVDLDPSASEKVAVWRFSQHFPSVPKVKGFNDLREKLFEEAFASQNYNWKTDIAPWLGDRVGVAAFLDDGKPQSVGILQIKDKAKAKAELAQTEAGRRGGYAIEDGYAILADTQAAVDDAVRLAKKHSIADNAQYKADMSSLPSERVMSAWIDTDGLVKLAAAQTADSPFAGDLDQLTAGKLPNFGRMALAVSVQADHVDVQAKEFGLDKMLRVGSGNAVNELAGLPGKTQVGAAVDHPGNLLKNFIDGIKTAGAANFVQQLFDQVSSATGLDLPSDLYSLLGSRLTVGVQGLSRNSDGPRNAPKLGIVSAPTDMTAAKKVASLLAPALASDSPNPGSPDFTVEASGKSFRLTSNGYDSSGRLGDSSAFKAAMSGLPSNAAVATYVDLTPFWTMFPRASKDARHLSSVSLAAGGDGSTAYFRLRVSVH